MNAGILRWMDVNILSLGQEMRLSYLPPLMVYVAYGVSGLTGIVGTFFVKGYLGLSAAFLAQAGVRATARSRRDTSTLMGRDKTDILAIPSGRKA